MLLNQSAFQPSAYFLWPVLMMLRLSNGMFQGTTL